MSNLWRLHVKYVETTCEICRDYMSNLCKQHVSAVKLPALVRLNLFFCAEVIVTDCTLELLWAALKFQVIQCCAFSLASLATMNTGENLGLKPAQYNCKGAINQRHTQLKHLDKRNWLVWPLPQTFWYDDSKMKYFRLTGDILRTQSFCGLQSVHAYLCWRGSLSHHNGTWVPAWSAIAIT